MTLNDCIAVRWCGHSKDEGYTWAQNESCRTSAQRTIPSSDRDYPPIQVQIGVAADRKCISMIELAWLCAVQD
jgi:hypothetical protein